MDDYSRARPMAARQTPQVSPKSPDSVWTPSRENLRQVSTPSLHPKWSTPRLSLGDSTKATVCARQNTQHRVILCRIHHNLRDMAWSTGGPLSRKNGAKLRCEGSRLSGTRYPYKPLSYYRCFQRRWSQNQ